MLAGTVQAAYELTNHGALFFDDLLMVTGLLPSQLEEALRELAALGLATADGLPAIRALDVHNKRGAFAFRLDLSNI